MFRTVEQLVQASSIWHSLLPFERSVLRRIGANESPLDSPSRDSSDWDLISETAFYSLSRDCSISTAHELALEKLSMLKGGTTKPLHQTGLSEAEALSNSMASWVQVMDPASVVWEPLVPGLGSMQEAKADLFLDTTLVEIKNVNRPFAPRDLRQAILYAVCFTQSGMDVDSITLLNARHGRTFHSHLQDASLQLCGESWVFLSDHISDMLQQMTAPDPNGVP